MVNISLYLALDSMGLVIQKSMKYIGEFLGNVEMWNYCTHSLPNASALSGNKEAVRRSEKKTKNNNIKGNQCKCSPADGWIKKMWDICTGCILAGWKLKGSNHKVTSRKTKSGWPWCDQHILCICVKVPSSGIMLYVDQSMQPF